MTPSVAALIPAFNCAAAIEAVVRGTRRHVAEVLVVDDGSSDGTAAAARRAGARVVVHERNCGKGPALRSGLAVLLGEAWTHVLMLDGDGQHDPEDIPGFLAAAERADLALGNRLHRPEAIPARRFWTNFIGTRALELMTGYPLEDSQCGFRLVAAPLLRRMGLVGNRYSVDTEILVRAGKLRARFAHVPVRVIYGGATPSHYRPLRDTVHIVFSAVRFKVDEGDRREDPGAEGWRGLVTAPPVLPPLQEAAT
ncbi:MAG TPA: glycosyltransferase family 2 protein [Thermoanaerobaculaceae bacterium]|nr:glycosyltransferase family 2 protein [Thermoanaerobaculaceae bacterium]HRS16727.1 glycosyltransferase family 2 protein [Thermoanaerobaculaceae bacterium]